MWEPNGVLSIELYSSKSVDHRSYKHKVQEFLAMLYKSLLFCLAAVLFIPAHSDAKEYVHHTSLSNHYNRHLFSDISSSPLDARSSLEWVNRLAVP